MKNATIVLFNVMIFVCAASTIQMHTWNFHNFSENFTMFTTVF